MLRPLAAALVTACGCVAAGPDGWAHSGGSLAGDRHVVPSAITPESVEGLALAWVYRTGEATNAEETRLRATPIIVDGKLVVSTGLNRVIAINPATGKELWTFDPEVDFSDGYREMFTSRGVAAWQDLNATQGACRARIFLGTLDARLIAIDADTGKACRDFGSGGDVDLSKDIPRYRKRDYSVTSPPTVVDDLVIVGSSIGDNDAAHVEPASCAPTTFAPAACVVVGSNPPRRQ